MDTPPTPDHNQASPELALQRRILRLAFGMLKAWEQYLMAKEAVQKRTEADDRT